MVKMQENLLQDFSKHIQFILKITWPKKKNFFDKAESEVLSKEEEYDMYEQFKSVMTISKKLEDMIKEIELFRKSASGFKN